MSYTIPRYKVYITRSLKFLKNVCQPSCFALLLFTSYLGNLSYNKK